MTLTSCKHCGAGLAENEVCHNPKCDRINLAILKPCEALKSCGVPLRYLKANELNWSDFNGIIEEVKGDPASYLLGGGVGVGKTSFAAYLMSLYVKDFVTNNNYNALWINYANLIIEIKSSYDRNTNISENDVIQKYSKIGLLVIDDLAAESFTENSVRIVYAILNNRYDYLRPTIVTTNVCLNDLNAASPRIASRLNSYDVVLGNKYFGKIDRRSTKRG